MGFTRQTLCLPTRPRNLSINPGIWKIAPDSRTTPRISRPPLSNDQTKQLLEQLYKLENKPRLKTSSTVEPIDVSYTDKATHVYVKVHEPRGLYPRFEGPWPIVSRPSRSQVQVKIGSYANSHECWATKDSSIDIYCDSQSAILALSSILICSGLVGETIELLNELAQEARSLTITLWFQLEDTVLLIGTLLLFDPVLFPKYEAWLLIGSIPNFEALLGAPLIKTT